MVAASLVSEEGGRAERALARWKDKENTTWGICLCQELIGACHARRGGGSQYSSATSKQGSKKALPHAMRRQRLSEFANFGYFWGRQSIVEKPLRARGLTQWHTAALTFALSLFDPTHRHLHEWQRSQVVGQGKAVPTDREKRQARSPPLFFCSIIDSIPNQAAPTRRIKPWRPAPPTTITNASSRRRASTPRPLRSVSW